MRCALDIPADTPPLIVDPEEPAVRCSLELFWEGVSEVWKTDCVVDTGCPVDFIASPQLCALLKRSSKPVRLTQVEWGERITCEVHRVAANLGEWIELQVHAPLDAEFEDLLGLPAILRSNLCIRGLAGSAYWVDLPEEGGGSEFIARDAELPSPPRSRLRKR